MLQSKGLPNNSLHLTGISLLLVENLSHDGDVSRQVNSSVMSPLRVDPTLIPAAPLLCHADLGEIIEWLVECE
jgi:hypothetical protein